MRITYCNTKHEYIIRLSGGEVASLVYNGIDERDDMAERIGEQCREVKDIDIMQEQPTEPIPSTFNVVERIEDLFSPEELRPIQNRE